MDTIDNQKFNNFFPILAYKDILDKYIVVNNSFNELIYTRVSQIICIDTCYGSARFDTFTRINVIVNKYIRNNRLIHFKTEINISDSNVHMRAMTQEEIVWYNKCVLGLKYIEFESTNFDTYQIF